MDNQPTNNTTFDIDAWYQQPIGKKVASLEKQQLNLLPKFLFGQSVLHLGAYVHCNGLDITNNHYSIIAKQTQNDNAGLYHVQCNYTELPFATNTFDAIILPHVLEFATNPKAIIMESWHTLAPEGHLIILGFNPISLNNLWYLCNKTKLDLPAQTKFHSINKIYQWLKNEYYEIISTRNFFYLPLTIENQPSEKWLLAEKLATWLLPYCGSLYLLILKKRVLPLTPLRLRWHWRELLSDKNIVEPAAGNVHRE